jgi:ribosome-binding protein aMBF1 (putative translation factor)
MSDHGDYSDNEHSILQRLRDSVIQMRKAPQRTTAPPTQQESNVRDAIRQVARSRVSEILRQLRAARGLSYEQVRERTGLPQQLLYDLEYKDRRLTLAEITALARCYDVSVNDVLGIDLEQ